jgi:hypothetical protein
MLNFFRTLICLAFVFSAAFLLQSPACAGGGAVVSLDGAQWKIAPQAETVGQGELISTADYHSGEWISAQVPGTVYGSYVIDKIEPEPTYADNIYKTDYSKYNRNFWYRTEFVKPTSFVSGRIWLNFDGVNRDADIFLNGVNIGSLKGFMQRGRFDVTSLVHPGTNALAVLDHLPDIGGKNNHENYSSPSFICSHGWDWMPNVPGLNMGIYKDVYLSNTGPVSLIDPWVRTELPSNTNAEISIQTDLLNSGTAPAEGEIDGDIEPGHIRFSAYATAAASGITTINLTDSTIEQLRIRNPRLWWPNGYGEPNLYTLHLTYKIGGVVSDFKNITFGIHKYTYDTKDDTLHFFVNGVRVFPKGGSWGMAEFMLRCNAADYDTKLRFHKEENFNMIRNWMGMTPDEAFYGACDKYGIMVWDEFWLNSSGGMPADVNIFRANTIEKIKTFRNHPSIALWCGMNEGTPAEPLNNWLRSDIQTYDHGDRYYQPNSHSGNLSGSGPWSLLSLTKYFNAMQPGWGGNGASYGTRSEVGIATVPSYDSMKKFLPAADLWPENGMWNQHFFVGTSSNAGPEAYVGAIDSQFEQSVNLQGFAEKAQLLNIESMKALFEGWDDHSDSGASAVLIWMSQSAYPSLVWQTYDYYYDLTGSYWGAKSACEPVHIYWNENDDRIRVSNLSGKDLKNLTAEASIYNLDGVRKYHNSAKLDSSASAVATAFTLTYPNDLSDVHFIKLTLKDSVGKVVSDNFYWRGNTYLDFSALTKLSPVKLGIISHAGKLGNSDTVTADITNPSNSKTVAFAIRPKLVFAANGEQVLPVYQNDSYFSLIPGETKRVTINFNHKLVGAAATKLVVECWNNNIPLAPPVDKLNIALRKPANASSNDDSASGPRAAVDGIDTSRWSSAWSAEPQWIMIDLKQSAPIGRVNLKWEAAYATSYSIQVSDDKTNWTTIYHTDTGKGGTEDLTNLKGTGRYIRIYCTKRATMFGYSLYEIAVYKPVS